MKLALRRFIVFNRLPIAAAMLLLGILLGFEVTWWLGWLPIAIAIILVVAHFLIGPMTLLQGYMEAGDMDGAKVIINKVKKPEWLYKPLRSTYYMLRGNLNTLNDDNLEAAEEDIRKGLAAGIGEKDAEGGAYFQLGAIALKKGNNKDALENLKKAVKIGLPDKDSEAMAYLYLCNIVANRRDFRNAKIYFSKAKACKSKNEQVVAQIKELTVYMSRLPG